MLYFCNLENVGVARGCIRTRRRLESWATREFYPRRHFSRVERESALARSFVANLRHRLRAPSSVFIVRPRLCSGGLHPSVLASLVIGSFVVIACVTAGALYPSVAAAPCCVLVPSIACVQAAPVSFEVSAGRRRCRLAEAVKIHPSRSRVLVNHDFLFQPIMNMP